MIQLKFVDCHSLATLCVSAFVPTIFGRAGTASRLAPTAHRCAGVSYLVAGCNGKFAAAGTHA
jgi:hypothetical protein